MASSSSRTALPVPEIGERLRAQFGDDIASVEDRFGHADVTIAAGRYREVATVLRDDPDFDCDFFDFLTAVDRPEENAIDVVVHVASLEQGTHVRVRTRLDRAEPSLPTISDIWPGANWHERETWELFGVVFEGHPHLVKLVLPEPFEGFPLRKDFVLMSREAKVWPGAAEGEEAEEE